MEDLPGRPAILNCALKERRESIGNVKGGGLEGRIMLWRLKDRELKRERPEAVLHLTLLFTSVLCRVF